MLLAWASLKHIIVQGVKSYLAVHSLSAFLPLQYYIMKDL